MTKGRPARLIVRFIIPVIIGNIFQQLYSMVDTIIVGRFLMKKMMWSKAAFYGASARAQTEDPQQTRTERSQV